MKRSWIRFNGKQVPIRIAIAALFAVSIASNSAWGILIVADYTYDTNGFFDTAAKKAGLEAAAARLSAIITNTLTGVLPTGTGSGTPAGWRIGFTHPGTGAAWQV